MDKKPQILNLNHFVLNATMANSFIFLWGFVSFLAIFYIRDFIYFSNSSPLIILKELSFIIATYILPPIITFATIYFTYFKNICINIYKAKDSTREISDKEKTQLLLSFQTFKTWIAWLFFAFAVVLIGFIINYYATSKVLISFVDINFYIWLLICLSTMCYISIIKTEFYVMQVRQFLNIFNADNKLFANKKLYYSAYNILIILLGLSTLFFNNITMNETKTIYQNNLLKSLSYQIDYQGTENNYIETLSNMSKRKIYHLYIPASQIKNNILTNYEHDNTKSSIIFLLITLNIVFLFTYTRYHIDLYSKFQKESISKTVNNVIENGFSTHQKINISTFGYLAKISLLINNLFDRININSNLISQNIKNINHIEEHNLDLIDAFKQYVNKTLKNTSEINSYLNQQNKKVKEQSVIINHNNLSIDLVNSKLNEQKNHLNSIDKSTNELNEQLSFLKKTAIKKNEVQNTFNSIVKEGLDTIDFNNNLYTNVKKNLSTASDINQSLTKISNQLDLLSMNASIEASHIGKLGEGFSAIASEIKQLAELCDSQCKDLRFELNEMLQKIYKTESGNSNYSQYFQDIHDNFFNENSFFDDINQINNFYENYTKGTLNVNQLFRSNNEKMLQELKIYIDNKDSLTTQIDTISEFNRDINNHIKGLLEISENEYIDLNTIFKNISKKRDNLTTLNNIFSKFITD